MAASKYYCTTLEEIFKREQVKQCEKELSERLVRFADSFKKKFREKMRTPEPPNSNLFDFFSLAFTELIQHAATKNLVSQGTHLVSSIIRRKEDKSKILEKLSYEYDFEKSLIKIAVNIFLIYQRQFIKENVENLAEDAVEIIYEYIKNYTQNELDFVKIALQPFVIRKTSSFRERMGRFVNRENCFKRIDKECGYVKRTNERTNEIKYFWSNKNRKDPEYGFKLIPADLVNFLTEELEEYQPQENYSYLLLEEYQVDKIVQVVKEIIKNAKNMESISINCDDKEPTENAEMGDEERKIKFERIMPPICNFTGRENELKEIDKKFYDEEQEKGTPIVVVCGMGGIGKTELVRKYVETCENIYWIDAENKQNIENMQDFYKSIKKKQNDLLIVLDNVNTTEDARALVPKELIDNLRILITSRITKWESSGSAIEKIQLDCFHEAYELIAKSLPSSEKEYIEELISRFDYLPLALQQAIVYIKNMQEIITNYTIKDYLKEFNEKMLNQDMFEDDVNYHDRYNLRTVYTTFDISFELVKNDKKYGKQAAELIYFMAYLEPTINVAFLKDFNKYQVLAINILKKYSLVNVREDKLSVHRLVQEVIRLKLEQEKPEFEEEILSKLILLKQIFAYVNLPVFSKRLHGKTHIVKAYYKETRINNIPFDKILNKGGEKLFETMLEAGCFETNQEEEEIVKATLDKYANLILDKCNLETGKRVLYKLNPKKAHRLIETFIKKGKVDVVELLTEHYLKNDETARQTYKLCALFFKKNKNETCEYLGEINLREIVEKSQTYFQKFSGALTHYNGKDVLNLTIDFDEEHSLGCLFKYLEKNKTDLYLKHAIKEKKETAFLKLARKENLPDEIDFISYACIYGTLEMVQHLEGLGRQSVVENLTFSCDYYLNCELDVFKYVLEKNDDNIFNLQAKDSFERSAIFYAATGGRVDLVKYLIEEKRQSIYAVDKEGNTLLHYASSLWDMDKEHNILSSKECYAKCEQLIIYLVNKGIDSSNCNFYEQTALLIASYHLKKEAIQCLLTNKYSTINEYDVDGRGPLHYAAMYKNYETITNILKFQHFSSFEEEKQKMHLFRYSEEVIKMLVNYAGDNTSERASDNNLALPTHYACMIFFTITKCVIFGPKSKDWHSLKDVRGNTPFHYAAMASNINLFYKLRIKDEEKQFPINNALLNNRKQNLLHLLANSKVERGFYDVEKYAKVLDWLINVKKLDENQQDTDGKTAIDYAKSNKNEDFTMAIQRIS